MADTTDDTPPTTVEVLACADCGRLDRVDPLTLLASGSEPCPCACGGVNLLCQICGKVIGWGSTSTVGTIDLDELPDGVTGERYRDLFREDTYGQRHPDITAINGESGGTGNDVHDLGLVRRHG